MQPLNIAHRGGAGLRPENTLAAFRYAIALGVDGAELDVQLSRDGQVVVFHDYRLNPDICRHGSGKWRSTPPPSVKEMTLAALRKFDVGRANPDSDYLRRHPDLVAVDGERIPTLAEVVHLVKRYQKRFRLFIELKTSTDIELSASPVDLADACVSVLHRYSFLENAVIVGFDWRGLQHVRRIAPEAECWFSTREADLASFNLRELRAMGGRGWFPEFRNIDANAVAQAHALDLKIGAWTVNDAAVMRFLIDYGIDAICTDRPDILTNLLS